MELNISKRITHEGIENIKAIPSKESKQLFSE